jgi:hypothetical protein
LDSIKTTLEGYIILILIRFPFILVAFALKLTAEAVVPSKSSPSMNCGGSLIGLTEPFIMFDYLVNNITSKIFFSYVKFALQESRL